MSWYAAHLIMYFKRRKGPQKRFLVWENIVLISAKSSDEAYERAEERGRYEQSFDDETLRIGNHLSRMIFAGVRKVTLCQDEDDQPTDGTEVTYSEWAVQSEAAIRKLVDGKNVDVKLLDPFPNEELQRVRQPTKDVLANGRKRRVS